MRDIRREVLAYPRRRAGAARLLIAGLAAALVWQTREAAANRLRVPCDVLGRWRRLACFLCAAVLACGGMIARAGSTNGTLASATFINSVYPNNNNGGASLIYLGQDFEGGSMRGLVRFNLSPSLTGRITVTACTLSITTASLAQSPPAAATVYLERLTQSWGQGSGAGIDVTGDYTTGSACSAGGATWNQPLCSGIVWSTAGGSVTGLSDSASAPASSGSSVQWKSSGVISDVQGWFNDPSSNYGWRLRSSTETTYDTIQAFAKNPQLSVSYGCKIGFLETAGGCTTCTAAAQTACVTSEAGNTCNDSGPPSTTYSCTCGNAAYAIGPEGTSCIDKNECIPNHCTDLGDTQAVCTDHVAPATGYDCTCSEGFVAIAGTCSDDIFLDGFEATGP